MIKTFASKALQELWNKGSTRLMRQDLQGRTLRRLDALEQADQAEDLNIPGFNFHPLKGFEPVRYSVHVNGPWCVTFEFDAGDAYRVDLEQYH